MLTINTHGVENRFFFTQDYKRAVVLFSQVEAGNTHKLQHGNLLLANCSVHQLRDWLAALQHGGKRGDRAISQIRAFTDPTLEFPSGAANSNFLAASSSSLDSSSAAVLMSMQHKARARAMAMMMTVCRRDGFGKICSCINIEVKY
jgi:hypothetical protein